ncbi:MAG: DNA cytosine methyltransferase [Clostridiales bacterium]|nr:DNA cytosine methyltransferase [Clostridiales bacterium]
MYKIIDLFCGIGGFSYGFEMTKRFETILGVDFWNVALNTFKVNHESTLVKQGDIRELKEEFWKTYIGKVDVIIAGPPCQGFSMAGKRDVLDERNNLFKEVIGIVRIVRPKVVVIENVVGLLSMTTADGLDVKEEIVRELNELGYNVQYKVLTASDYGVPQNRKRVIFIASLINNVKFPIPKFGVEGNPVITVGDALGNIPNEGKEYLEPQNEYQRLMSGRRDILNHEPIHHADLIVKRMHSVPQGGNWQDIPLELGQGGGKHSNNYRRLKSDEPSITIKHVSKSMIIHPIYDRTPTVREVARIQSFNDNFELTGTKYDQHQQLANAVPPILGKAIAEVVLDMLGDYNVKND